MVPPATVLSKNDLDREFSERRQSERISAKLAVRVAVLKPSQHEFYQKSFDELRRRFLMSVEYNRLSLLGRRALKDVKLPQSQLVTFAESMEKRLEMLGNLSGLATHAVAPGSRQTVHLNMQGVRFSHPENIEPNSLVCLRLVGYQAPMLALFTLANVVHCSVESDQETGAHVDVAVRIEKIHDDDVVQLRSFLAVQESRAKIAA